MNKIYNILVAMISVALFSSSTNGQNLVLNGSFEQYYSCPDELDQVDSCVGWQNVLYSPDYYNECSPYPVSIPDNSAGNQLPFNGNAYLGFITYTPSLSNYREIIGSQLIGSLIPGNTYHVSMRVSRGAKCSKASNKIGVRLTTFPYSFSSPPSINNYSQIYTDSIITDTLNWVLLAWDYIADSAYNFLSIGNFFTDSTTDTLSFGISHYPDAYYFIDSVNISCSNGNSEICYTGIKEQENNYHLTCYPNPARDLIEIKGDKIQSLTLYDVLGRITYMSDADFVSPLLINTSSYPRGVYLLQAKTKNTVITQKVILQ